MLNRRMFVPKKLRSDVLESLHAVHQGTTSMKSSARARFWWPGMDAGIVQTRDQCRKCNEGMPSQPGEEWLEETAPTFPFEKICCDYFEQKGSHYLAQADRYSGWLSIAKVNSTAFSDLSPILRTSFSWHGVPDQIETDGGPPFNGNEFKDFCKKWQIRHRLSSAGYPQSNGRAELAVKTAKRIIGESTDIDGTLNTDAVVAGILCYKNTPLRGCNESPAEILFGHKLQDNLPRAPHEGWRRLNDAREMGMARLKVNRKETYDESRKNLEPLENGTVVLVQNMTGPQPLRWSNTGVVIEKVGHRQYYVKMDGSRRLLLRNRKSLRPIKPIQEESTTKTQIPKYGGMRNVPFPATPSSPSYSEKRAPEASGSNKTKHDEIHENDITPMREVQKPSRRRIIPGGSTSNESPPASSQAPQPSPRTGSTPQPSSRTGSTPSINQTPRSPPPLFESSPQRHNSTPATPTGENSARPTALDESTPRTRNGYEPGDTERNQELGRGRRIRKKPARHGDYVEWDENDE